MDSVRAGPAPGPSPGGSCDCIPCGSSTPATWSSGSWSPASGQCGPSVGVGGSGCYTDCGSSCDCGSHTCRQYQGIGYGDCGKEGDGIQDSEGQRW
jgi:hypothetical protein